MDGKELAQLEQIHSRNGCPYTWQTGKEAGKGVNLEHIYKRLSLWPKYYAEVLEAKSTMPNIVIDTKAVEHLDAELILSSFKKSGWLLVSATGHEPTMTYRIFNFDQWLFSKRHYDLVIDFTCVRDIILPEVAFPELRFIDTKISKNVTDFIDYMGYEKKRMYDTIGIPADRIGVPN